MRVGVVAALILALAIPADAQEKPILVVALFRHGIRPPLKQFGEKTGNAHSGDDWPLPKAWGAADWGDLTAHGKKVVAVLGGDYARIYKPSSAYLWADTDARTIATAQALVQGFVNAGVPASYES